MADNRGDLVRSVFLEALGLSGDKRARLLEERCGGDAELRREVESLLAHQREGSAFLQSPAVNLTVPLERLSPAPRPGLEQPGDLIGTYRLVHVLGEGGFGAVWLAEQLEPVKRRVALKVIKPGMDSKAVVARFEAERQALALMEHPNIAKVFEAGTTPSGRPYFVMEHVPGIPITEHCDRQRISVKGRLELFAQVCDAVHHAHMKGIIHRDLKPGNILVAAKDETTAIVKIIDFGVAKATQMRLTEKTVFTEQGMLIGTPEYMSPEQAEMSAQDIDTRSDIYSLGVVLYELLVGDVPFNAKELRSKGYAEIQRIIREVDPPRPSAKLTRISPATTVVADARRTRTADLSSLLRRELEWIPLRAMRKNRAERYHSAAEMADDLRNYLSGKPIVARGESWPYLTRKFVRRHRTGVAMLAAVLLSLAAGLTAAVWQWRQAKATYSQVLTLAQSHIDLQQKIGDRVGSTAAQRLLIESSLPALNGLARVAKPDAALSDLIARGYSSLGAIARDSPGSGSLERAIEAHTGALDQRLKLAAQRPGDLGAQCEVGFALINLASAQLERGVANGAESLREALTLSATLTSKHPQDPAVRGLRASARAIEGREQMKSGDLASAGAAFQESSSIRLSLRGDPAQDRTRAELDAATSLVDLGLWHEASGRQAEAEGEYARANDILTPLAAASAQSINVQLAFITARTRLGHLLINESFQSGDRLEEATRLLDEAGKAAIRLVEDDPLSERSAAMLRRHYQNEGDAFFARGRALKEEGKVAEGEALIRKSLEFLHPFVEKSRRAYEIDPEVPTRSYTYAVACENNAVSHWVLGEITGAASEKRAAIPLLREAVELYRKTAKAESMTRRRMRSGYCLTILAGICDDLKLTDETIAANAEAVDDLLAAQADPEYRQEATLDLSYASRNLGYALLDYKGDAAGSIAALKRALATMPKDDPYAGMVHAYLGRAALALSPPDQKLAATELDIATSADQNLKDFDDNQRVCFAESCLLLGRIRSAAGHQERAKELWKRGVEALEKLVNPEADTRHIADSLREHLRGSGSERR